MDYAQSDAEINKMNDYGQCESPHSWRKLHLALHSTSSAMALDDFLMDVLVLSMSELLKEEKKNDVRSNKSDKTPGETRGFVIF